MIPAPELNLSAILNVFYRRKSLIIVTVPVVFVLAAYLAKTLPDVYRSSTLILITPQKLPSSYVSSTVTSSIQERINAITQQILSRTSLEKIVQEFNLYPPAGRGVTMEDRVQQLRNNIRINISRNDAFRLSFDDGQPEKAMQLATRLASLFIEENLKVREQQAIGTTTFINAEADRLRKELEEREARVSQYRTQHRFELPDQLDANLRTVQQIRAELQSSIQNLTALQERKAALEKQLAETPAMLPGAEPGPEPDPGPGGPFRQQIEARKTQLEALRMQYRDKHPDMVRLQREIEALEAEDLIYQSKRKKTPASKPAGPTKNPLQQVLRKQLADVDSEISSVQARNESLRGLISTYQARVDNTQLRAIDLIKINRDYDITLRKYQDLSGKGLESQLSENMEKKQKGEQFQVLDPANFPQRPVRPNRPLLLVMGLVGGLGAGFALAILLETLDTSFKRSEEVDNYVNIPVIATLPAVLTRGTILEYRRAQGLLILASGGILAIGLVLIHFFGSRFF
ncbi:MAG: hypothetical protein HY695_31360 [Deltaproteobacteria bacterium]|nr:hypothetical protein [Deltaproteobacteria bacterium]